MPAVGVAKGSAVKAMGVLWALGISAFLLAGCSDDKPVAAAQQGGSEAVLKKDCTDPKWREQNLGLWYSVCRRPLRW